MSEAIFTRDIGRSFAALLMSAALVLACAPPASAAIIWEKEASGNISLAPTWTDLAYQWELHSHDESLSQSSSRVHVKMQARNIGRAVGDGAIRVQSFLTSSGSLINPDNFTTVPGPAVTNRGSNPMNEWVISQYDEQYFAPRGVLCHGNAILRKPDLTNATVNTPRYLVVALELGIDPKGAHGEEDMLKVRDVELRADGRTYGSPYAGLNGETIMPDMLRVVATNGEIGYVSMDEMDDGIMLGASTSEKETEAYALIDELKAQALKRAFAEHYGVDALSIEEARECALELVFENGERDSRLAATRCSEAELASAIKAGAMSAERASALLGLSVDSAFAQTSAPSMTSAVANPGVIEPIKITIGEDAYVEILEQVRAETAIYLPVYAEDGVTTIGELVVNRF